MRAASLMTPDVTVVTPDESLRRAAQMMDDLNVGALPVCEGHSLIGMITDRDITVRATAAGLPPDGTTVAEAMSTDVKWCLEDDSVEDVVAEMAAMQIRRMPVIDSDRRLVGIVSLGDLAVRNEDEVSIENTLADISRPSRPDR